MNLNNFKVKNRSHLTSRLVELAKSSLHHLDEPWRVYQIRNYEVYESLSPSHREVLKQLLFKGPVWDGDVLSKSHRDDLIRWGLAVKCCFRGEQGYTAASYAAYTVHKCGKEAGCDS